MLKSEKKKILEGPRSRLVLKKLSVYSAEGGTLRKVPGCARGRARGTQRGQKRDGGAGS